MVRISTALMFQRSLTAMLKQQHSVSETQLQLSSGRRILTPSDDPAGAARVLNLNGAIDTVRQFQTNAERAQGRLETEEGVLVGVENILQRVNELTIQGNNDSLTQVDRHAVAGEVRQLLEQVLSLANTRDSNGEYIFGGYQSGSIPFSRSALGTHSYNGDMGQRMLQISPDRQVADGDTGFDVFVDVPTAPVASVSGFAATAFGAIAAGDITIDGGNGAGPIGLGAIPAAANAQERAVQLRDAVNLVTSQTGVRAYNGTSDTMTMTVVDGAGITVGLAGTASPANTGLTAGNTLAFASNRNIMDTLGELAVALESSQPLDRYIADVQLGLNNILDYRASVGARLNAIDTQKEINTDLELSLETHRSEEQDLDYTEAITRFERQMMALEAAQQTYVRIQGLSLFNYLG